MRIREIQQFAEIRPKARAYLCFLLSRNIPDRMPEIQLDAIVTGMKNIRKEIPAFDALYVLDATGNQLINNISKSPKYRKGKGENRSDRAYYYRAVREKRCALTDPYPSLLNNDLTVTASYPIYNDKGQLRYVVCVDVALDKMLQIVHPTSVNSLFGRFSKTVYACFSIALMAVAFILFTAGTKSFFIHGLDLNKLNIKDMFEATILLTLALAIFDLVKAIFEEEVLGNSRRDHDRETHKTMVRFLGSIIIALAIEALMLVFKFAIIGPEKLLYAVCLLGGVTMLLIGLSVYLRAVRNPND